MHYIIGPCAAESYEQLAAVASRLQAGETLRAGVWKPRTSPTSFQGAGNEALEWLTHIRRETGRMIATEVATPEHIQAAVAVGMDELWIGARTAANPIAVQELADTLVSEHAAAHGLKKLWIKNPVNEDEALWEGNIERLNAVGVPVGAIHRGCMHRPSWQMAYTLRSHRPDIPLLLDPSHLSGDAADVPALCRKAISELALDGLMVEVHPHPARALSDSKQQITPDTWQQIHQQLPAEKPQNDTTLNWLRATMDEVDDELWQVLLRRQQVSREIGQYKRHADIAPLQPGRWQQVLDRRLLWAENNGLHREDVEQIMNAIHHLSLAEQEVKSGES